MSSDYPAADPASSQVGDPATDAGFPHDPEAAEDYAESVGTDPTPEEIDHYLELEGDAPLGEPRG